jgi:hypothetical protein
MYIKKEALHSVLDGAALGLSRESGKRYGAGGKQSSKKLNRVGAHRSVQVLAWRL